jgi:ribosomal protein S18 acetylase RimI-like enzyme
MTLAFEIREAAPSDAESLCAFAWRVFVETFLEDLGCAYPEADIATFREEAYRPEVYSRWIASDDFGVWVAEQGGSFLGYAVTCPCSFDHELACPQYGELKRLYVGREVQGRGIAPALLACAVDRLRSQQRAPILLSVWSENHRAQAFYLKHGFEKIAEFKFPVGETMDDEFLMRLD